ncbi:MAG: glycosyltransferase family 4 protein [Peptococcaceae bacterium]|nr:glycosyltransferase family 4 protein [Peptococcaceae bacterium]
MRIAIFTDSYRPYTSGVVRSIETFSDELNALGHKVYIFAPRYSQSKPQEERVFRFYSLPSPTNPGYNIAIPISLRLRSTLRQLKIDLIHTHSPFLLGRLGARAARDLGLPLIFTYHTLYDHYVHYFPVARNFTRKVTQRLCVDYCNRCHRVLVPTWVIGNYIKNLGVKTPLVKLPTGIKVDEFRRGIKGWLRQRLCIGDNEKVLIFVGRMGLEKNIGFLIRAFGIAVNKVPKVPMKLVLVGGGPETENFKRLAGSLGLGGRVVFAGPVSKEEVAHCYADADLFVFASTTETQGLVIGEAKSAGLPVVAVDAFGVSEMVSHGEDGYLTPLDEHMFADSVIKLLINDHLYRRMSANAYTKAEELSARAQALRLEKVYQELLQNKA